jgi:CubicO group peptidase (beta-lactamase class C family)
LALLYGHAINDGKIRLTDKVVDVLPDFAGSAFANDSVEDLLRMSSGAALVNSYTGPADNGASNPMNLQGGGDLRAILKSKTTVRAPPGTVFDYNGMQSALLGLMLRERLGGQTLTAYLEEKIWKPMGAEHPAVWIKDKQGYEGVQGQFGASVRDYAKLGSLFVNKGVANGQQVVPASWIEAMTRIDRSRPQPKDGTLYGLHVWLTSQGQGRGRFAGTYGQHIAFDPVAKLVMVQTAAAKTAEDEGNPHFFTIRNSLAASLTGK